MKISPTLFSPAYPAIVLLFGMTAMLALAYFFRISLSPLAAAALYSGLLAWILMLAWHLRRRMVSLTAFDGFFFAFVLCILVSITIQGHIEIGAAHYVRYLPFMVVAPYICGRMMKSFDIVHLYRIVLFSCLSILPLLLLDRYISPISDAGRFPIFGLDHGALLVGALLASGLLALFIWPMGKGEIWNSIRTRIIYYTLTGLVTGFLVWVSARGWLLAAMVGFGVLTLVDLRQRGFNSPYFFRLAYIVVVIFIAMALLPAPTGHFYARLIYSPMAAISKASGPVSSPATTPVGDAVSGPILGDESCAPFREGNNSIAMRRVLYRESVEIFLQSPILGIGAGRFMDRSCTGDYGFPHNTILQAFAELGLIGGTLFLGLLLLATRTLLRHLLENRGRPNSTVAPFALGFFSSVLVADQFYGNYFMAIGTNLALGIASSIYAKSMESGNA